MDFWWVPGRAQRALASLYIGEWGTGLTLFAEPWCWDCSKLSCLRTVALLLKVSHGGSGVAHINRYRSSGMPELGSSGGALAKGISYDDLSNQETVCFVCENFSEGWLRNGQAICRGRGSNSHKQWNFTGNCAWKALAKVILVSQLMAVM